MSVTILQNCAIAPVVGEEYSDGHVVVRDGRIAAVGAGHAGRFHGEQVRMIDATGCLVMPGLVNTHAHLAMNLFRGEADEVRVERAGVCQGHVELACTMNDVAVCKNKSIRSNDKP